MRKFEVDVKVFATVKKTVIAETPLDAVDKVVDDYEDGSFLIRLTPKMVDDLIISASEINKVEQLETVSTVLSGITNFKYDGITFSCKELNEFDKKFLSDIEDDEDYDEDFEDMDCENCPYVDECKRKEQLE